MPKIRMHTRQTGSLGEDIACSYLSDKGFLVVDRNYQKKWGELDIVAKKGQALHFIEVKSVTYISGGRDLGSSEHRPENNVHGLKVRNIRRMVETYMVERGYSVETEFYFHVVCVFMDLERRLARVKWIENIIL